MVISTGIDLIEIERVQRIVEHYGRRFLDRIFTQGELADAANNVASLAVRFAAKEAAAKALGTGIGPVSWQEIEILRNPTGQPLLYLHGAAAQKAAESGLTNWTVSLSHTQAYATAIVIAY